MPHSSFDTPIAIRRLWALDQRSITDHFLRLDTETRRARFAGMISDDGIRTVAEKVLSYDSVVCGAFVHGALHAVAELRGLTHRWPGTAEAAFSVDMDWQNRGIGDALLDHILGRAQNRGVKTLQMICLRDNGRMRRLAAKHNARLQVEPGAIIATLNPHWPTPVTLYREVLHDTGGMAHALLRWPRSGYGQRWVR